MKAFAGSGDLRSLTDVLNSTSIEVALPLVKLQIIEMRSSSQLAVFYQIVFIYNGEIRSRRFYKFYDMLIEILEPVILKGYGPGAW